MLVDLYNLFNRNLNGKTPLEDFNTECFAGVLQHHPNVLETFTKWLNLPEGNYKVITQSKHYLEDDLNCIIDMVLESNETLCFIEYKVNSKEGCEQLNRYSKVLNKQNNKATYLKYCTKYVDIKNSKDHHFSQFRWHEVAKILENNHSDIPLTKDTSISTDTVIAMNKFLQTYEAINFHIMNALPEFKKQFPKGEIVKEDSITKIKEHDRISRSIHRILKDDSKHSELMYAIYFEDVKLQVTIWVNINHPLMDKILKKANDSNVFKTWKNEWGIGVYLDCKLYQFIDDKNSDQKIKEWFVNSFQTLRKFIDDNPDLEWNNKLF